MNRQLAQEFSQEEGRGDYSNLLIYNSFGMYSEYNAIIKIIFGSFGEYRISSRKFNLENNNNIERIRFSLEVQIIILNFILNKVKK
jgi:hypothetical protein